MPNGKGRMPQDIRGFNFHLISTAGYIHQTSPLPSILTNGVRIGWKTEDVAKWDSMLARWETNMLLYADKKGSRTTRVKDIALAIIKEAHDYNRENKLYDRVAANLDATIADFDIFNITHGTPMEDVVPSRVAEPGTKTVAIVLKKSGHLFHELLITNPDQSGRAKEDGVKEIMVFKAIGLATAVAPEMSAFAYAGDVSRGTVTVINDSENIGKKAWYYACVKNSKGELGIPSEVVGFIIT